MESRTSLLQRRLPQDPKRVYGQPIGARGESGFVNRRHHDHSTSGTFSPYRSYRKSYGMATGTSGVEVILLNRGKPQALPADEFGPVHLTEEQRAAMDNTGLQVVRQEMRVVGVPVGTKQFKRDFFQDAINGEPAELVRALIPTEDAQANFQILRLSAAFHLSHLLRTVPPSIICQAAANYDALEEWALASIIAGDGAAAAGLPTPEELVHNPTLCQT